MNVTIPRTVARRRTVCGGLSAAYCLFFSSVPAHAADIPVQSGQTVAFLGDSITANGWIHPAGYVRLVVSALRTGGVPITPIPAGVSGNTSKDMLKRLDRDVLSKKPDWMTLSCGVNDVFHGAAGVPIDQYKVNITSIVDQAEAAGIKVMILTATPIREDLGNDYNKKLAEYNDFLRRLASEKHCLLADLNAAEQEALKPKTGKGNFLTVDGIHMNPHGDEVMASTIAASFGLTLEQLAAAKAAWLDIPGGWTLEMSYHDTNGTKNARNQPANVLHARVPLTIRQYETLNATAAAQGTSETAAANKLFQADVAALLKPVGVYDSVDAIFAAGQQAAVQKQLEDQLNGQVGAK